MGPRTHEVHVAPEDVDELGKLVQPKLPQPHPDARDPIAVVLLPLGLRPADRAHGAELDQLEGLPVQPHALLDEEHGTTRVELDQQHDEADEGVAVVRLPLDLLDDLAPEGACPEDQHALADVTTAPDAVTQA